MLLIYKFHPDSDTEYRDRGVFNCEGLHFDSSIRELNISMEELKIPSDSERQPVFGLHFLEVH
ncbi:MAG: hypothetical protein ACRBB5_01850 [Nitrosopumilus sp.]